MACGGNVEGAEIGLNMGDGGMAGWRSGVKKKKKKGRRACYC